MARVCTALLSVLVLAACANTETVLRNDKGEARYCYLVHQGGPEREAAGGQYSKCLNDAGSAGFRRLEPRPAPQLWITPSN